MHGAAILERRLLDFPDARQGSRDLAAGLKNFLASGYRAITIMPLMRGKDAIGALSVVRRAPGGLSDKQIEVLRTFAAQAVIAIDNTRLLNELRQRTDDLTESLQHQTATSEVLGVISRSPTNAQPVFEAIVESAERLCGGVFSVVWLYDGQLLHYAASHNFTPEVLDHIAKIYPKQPERSVAAGRAILDGGIAHVPDMLADTEYAHELALAGNWRASIAVPMLRDGKPVGAISVGKAEAVPFSERQLQLLTTFADQAGIAIENVRLFEEVKKRTEDLSESLQQQTATADVLKVISRSAFDLQTVLDTLIESAVRLCDADHGWVFRREDDLSHWAAGFGHSVEERLQIMDYFKMRELHADRGSLTGRCAMEGRVIHVSDVLGDPDYKWQGAQKIGGYRAGLAAPLLGDGKVVGVIFLSKNWFSRSPKSRSSL
jgi:GAF domain-containing protein